VEELDGLRGLAILLVVVYHGGGLGAGGGGVVGVTLFFVLSGYLITSLLRREHQATGRIDLRAFWARRARRLLPAFGPVAVFTVVLLAAGGSAVGIAVVLGAPIADYLRAFAVPLPPLEHTWSLAVEEQFYLLWPFAVTWLASRRRPVRWLVVATVVLAAWRVLATLSGLGFWAYHALDTNAFALLAGAALAYGGGRLSWRWGASAAIALIAVAWLPLDIRGFSLLAPLVAALGVVAVAGARGVPGLLWTPLRLAGLVSYSWYLWHYALVRVAGEDVVALRWLACLLGLLLAAISWRVIEAPALARGREHRARQGPARGVAIASHEAA
jgi:peptidoglycan/LPS O-acetylase OafA/YrhL